MSLKSLIFFCQALKDFTEICQINDFKCLNSSKTQINKFLSNNVQQDLYCLLLKKSLPRFNFLEILKLQDQFCSAVTPKYSCALDITIANLGKYQTICDNL